MAPLITPDFSEAVELTPLPPGTYNVRVTGCEQKVSNTSGNPYLNWKLETWGSNETSRNNRNVFHTTPMTGKGAGILRQFLVAAMGEAPSGAFDTDAVLGRELKVTVIEEVNNQTGEKTGYVRVKSVAPLKS